MTSIKQKVANAQNGKKGGPKTSEGRSRVRLNAVKHGLLSRDVLLPGEDVEAFNQMRQNLRDEYKPQGQVEEIQVELVATNCWRLLRSIRIETAALWPDMLKAWADALNEGKDPNLGWRNIYISELWVNSRLLNLNRYQVSIERQYYKALSELNRLRAARQGPITPPPVDTSVTVIPKE
ncbi:hypothetical protein ACFLVG_03645 [Chloroflexota bacterium]